MIALILGMLLCVALAVAVVAFVAIPAKRAGRTALSPEGEDMVGSLKERAESAASAVGSKD